MPKRWLEILIVLVIVAVLVAMLLPRPQIAGFGSARREKCRDNLHQIAIALHNYHDEYRCFPPAYVADADGRPMHSWRVLLLPYLEQQQLYERYDFSQPWNAPANAQLANEFPIPDVFLCPSDSADEDGSEAPDDERLPHNTTYLAVVGPHTCWPGAEPISLHQIADDTAETLIVVESSDSGIHWMEPRDLHVAQMAPTINPAAGQGIQSPHRVGATALFADGHVWFLSEELDSETIRRLVERDDGEIVGNF